MGFIRGWPTDPQDGYDAMRPIAIVLHRTYPPRKKVDYDSYPGDYGSIKAGELCQFLIGKYDGQYVQFMSTDRVAYHCDGANWKAFGVELSGYNEEPLTEWQVGKLHEILWWAHDQYAIPLTYADPATTEHASIWVDGGNFRGVISHDSVRTDEAVQQPDGTWKSDQHTDAVTLADFQRAVEGDDMTPDQANQLNAVTVQMGELMNMMKDESNGVWRAGIPQLRAQVASLETQVAEIQVAAGPSSFKVTSTVEPA